jgi:hypothetical protein
MPGELEVAPVGEHSLAEVVVGAGRAEDQLTGDFLEGLRVDDVLEAHLAGVLGDEGTVVAVCPRASGQQDDDGQSAITVIGNRLVLADRVWLYVGCGRPEPLAQSVWLANKPSCPATAQNPQ